MHIVQESAGMQNLGFRCNFSPFNFSVCHRTQELITIC